MVRATDSEQLFVGPGVRDNALLIGLRSRADHVFVAGACRYCAGHGVPKTDGSGTITGTPQTAFAYDLSAHADFWAAGFALAVSGVVRTPEDELCRRHAWRGARVVRTLEEAPGLIVPTVDWGKSRGPYLLTRQHRDGRGSDRVSYFSALHGFGQRIGCAAGGRREQALEHDVRRNIVGDVTRDDLAGIVASWLANRGRPHTHTGGGTLALDGQPQMALRFNKPTPI